MFILLTLLESNQPSLAHSHTTGMDDQSTHVSSYVQGVTSCLGIGDFPVGLSRF